MTKPNETKQPIIGGSCGALFTISEDFHQLLRSSCPRCATGSGVCSVEAVRHALAAESQGIARAPVERSQLPQIMWH